jgi:hypothetical protein
MENLMTPKSNHSWRITKYDPIHRNERGHYLKDEWTSIADIGRIYDGHEFTADSYRIVEDAYVATALEFLAEAGCNGLKITYLEPPRLLDQSAKYLQDIVLDPRAVSRYSIVTGAELNDLCRMVLREILWCKLESENGFYLHFGYDYYMYVGSPCFSEKSIAYGRQQNLFIEEMESPYLKAGDGL